MYQRALMGKEKALGSEHTSTLNTVGNLGRLYWHQGKLTEAEAMFQQALVGYEKSLGPKCKSALVIAKNLGKLYRKQGRHAEADAIEQHAQAPQSQQ
jgi:tetratricopeptide (TPR) repeat protein